MGQLVLKQAASFRTSQVLNGLYKTHAPTLSDTLYRIAGKFGKSQAIHQTKPSKFLLTIITFWLNLFICPTFFHQMLKTRKFTKLSCYTVYDLMTLILIDRLKVQLVIYDASLELYSNYLYALINAWLSLNCMIIIIIILWLCITGKQH